MTQPGRPRAGVGEVSWRGRARSRRRWNHRGQSTVELALLLPVLAVLMLALIQVGLLVRVRVMVTHAAREAARVAAVGVDDDGVRRAAAAAADLDPRRIGVRVSRAGERVTVEVRYDDPTEVPVVGALLGDARFDARATMRLEG